MNAGAITQAPLPEPDKIVIFDYSGTLSLEAPRFGRPESLARALADTGLAALGIATPEAYWDEIVNPTWTEGSTTRTGYGKLMARRIAALGLAPGVPAEEIEAAASRFVGRYLAHSGIDPRWHPLLSRLSGRPDAVTIIATDHYAEATEAIIGFLRDWNIPTSRVGEAGAWPDLLRTAAAEIQGQPPRGPSQNNEGTEPLLSSSLKRGKTEPLSPFFVANSAELGAWKGDRRFWEGAKKALSPGVPRRLLLIDDFGFNEQAGDLYGEGAAIRRRRERTAALLREAFLITPEVIPFFLEEDPRATEDAAVRLIAETTARIENFLDRGEES